MLILAVDTSTRSGSAAVLKDMEILAEVSGVEETPYSTRLFRDVAALQSKAHFSLNQVDLFAVAAGPGSFTGLRVGLTAVKAWAEVHHKPIAAISGLEAIASEFPHMQSADSSNGSGCLIAPFLDARRGFVFGAVYRRALREGAALELVTEEAILPVGEFLELVANRSNQQALLVTPTPEAISIEKARAILPRVRIERVAAALAPSIARLGYGRAQRGDLVDPIRLDANYVRRSDAEAARKD
jgi:tRNA threonylcarbamoyladenosine biosynthesis protein TsaB